MKKFRKMILRVLLLAGVVAAAWGGYRFMQQLPQRQREVPTAHVRRGDVVVRTFSRGELRAVRSVTMIAPNLFGSVQVTKLAPLGGFAREGDLIVEFDDSEVLGRLEEKQIELDQTDERIKKSEADLAIRTNQDEVELLRARYAVRRADLEVKRNELLSAIDAKKNELNLKEAQQRLDKLKSDIESRRRQAEAEIAVLREEKNKAELEMAREKQRLRQVKVLAPMGGLVAIRQQRGNFFFAGTQMPDIREGDELRPGMPVADILDLSELEIMARVGELDRANLLEGQSVLIHLDALPDKSISGKIKGLSGTASSDPYSSDPAKKFDVTFEINMRQLLQTLGAKPDQVQRILQTAEQNRKRSPAQAPQPPMMLAGLMTPGGGGFGGGAPAGAARPAGFAGAAAGGFQGGAAAGGGGFPGGGQQGAEAGPGGGAGGQRRSGGGLAQMLSRLPEGQRKKAQEALDKELKGKKLEELTQQERRDISRKLRESGVMGQGGGAPGVGGPPGAGAEMAPTGRTGSSQFNEAQLAQAKLPPPPEEDSQLDVLLRPGLLADVQIIVEKIANVIYIPVQAIFEKEDRSMVYVKRGDKFEERFVKPMKRSENTMVITEGLSENEIVALADPYAKPGAKKQDEKPGSSQGSPMGGFSGGGGGGGSR